MKITKIIGTIFILFILAVGGIAYYVLSNINSIVEREAERAGYKALQTSVDVSGVDIRLLDGKGSISALTIANPKGFSGNKFLSVGNVVLQIDTASLTKKVKVIKNISVEGVKLRGEQINIKDTNVEALINNMKKASGVSTQPNTSGSTSSSEDIRLMIESLRFGESEISLETEKYGGKTLSLPAYTQRNIGDKTTGLTPDQITEVIMSNLLNKVEKTVKRSLREAAKSKAEEKVKEKLKDELGDKISEDDVDKIKNLFK